MTVERCSESTDHDVQSITIEERIEAVYSRKYATPESDDK